MKWNGGTPPGVFAVRICRGFLAFPFGALCGSRIQLGSEWIVAGRR